MVADDRAQAAWLAGAVLAPLGLGFRFVPAVPDPPEGDLLILAAGAPLAREAGARDLALRTGLPVVVLLGRRAEDLEGLRAAGVRPVLWPHAPVQIQEAVLEALGVSAGGRQAEPPHAPRVHRRP